MANAIYTVQKNDTLSKISKGVKVDGKTYKPSIKNLVAWNKIKNANLIYKGQKLIVGTTDNKSVKTSSTASTKNSNSNKVKIDKFDIQSGTTSTAFVTWSWNKENTKEYKVVWYYSTGDGVFFDGGSSTVTRKNATVSIQNNAKKIKVKVKPIAKTHKVTTGKGKNQKKEEVEYWKAEWSKEAILPVNDAQYPQKPDNIGGNLENLKLTVTASELANKYATDVCFQLVRRIEKKNDSGNVIGYNIENVQKINSPISNDMATAIFNLSVGQRYKIRAQTYKGKEYSEWSNYEPSGDSWYVTKPDVIDFEWVKALDKDTIQCHWPGEKSTADSFEIEYTMDVKYFNSNSDKVYKATSLESREYLEITGFEEKTQQPGGAGIYYFRLRGKIGEQYGKWSGDVEKPESFHKVMMGVKPGIPTTWSNVQTAFAGEKINFYWLHNTMDGSSENRAKLHLKIIPTDGGSIIEQDIVIPNERPEDLRNSPGVYILDTAVGAYNYNGTTLLIPPENFKEDTKILWYVCTCGVTNEYSGPSTTREVQLYEKPYVTPFVTNQDQQDINVVTQFPFYISAQAGPNTQTPIGYHFIVRAKEGYITTDEKGEEKIVSKDDEIYSKYFDPNVERGVPGFDRNITLQMLPNNIDLENNIEYELECTVTMNNGLRATNTTDFTVSWIDEEFTPTAKIIIDHMDYSAQIRPICKFIPLVHKKVEIIDNKYTLTDEIVDIGWDDKHENSGELVMNAFIGDEVGSEEDIDIDTNPDIDEDDLIMVFTDIDENNNSIMYAEVEGEAELVQNITLGVYRKEFDGTFTEIQTGIPNNGTSVPDPHPSLDWARYRITVTKNDTGAISYTDVMEAVSGSEKLDYEDRYPGIIIQWNEKWTDFKVSDVDSGDQPEQPAYSGSLLKLPYNVDISDSNDKDIELIEYIGRNHPVSYFGTQIGQTSNWNFEIEADDSETLYGLRRLARWMGNVYVREASGTGYNATVSLNINQTHNAVTIPISMSVTRVEGGI